MPETAALNGLSPSSTPNGLSEGPPDERRRHLRFSTTLEVQTAWQDEFGMPCGSAGIVRDVSAGGFGVELKQKPPRSALLTVTAMRGSMRCVVRYVRQEDDCFVVGLELLPESDGTTITQSLERLAAALSEDRRARARDRRVSGEEKSDRDQAS